MNSLSISDVDARLSIVGKARICKSIDRAKEKKTEKESRRKKTGEKRRRRRTRIVLLPLTDVVV